MQKLPPSLSTTQFGQPLNPGSTFATLSETPDTSSPTPNYLRSSSKTDGFESCVERKTEDVLDIDSRFNKDPFRNVSESLDDTFGVITHSGRMKESTIDPDWSTIASLQEDQRNELLLRSCKGIPGVASAPMQYLPAPPFIAHSTVSINESFNKVQGVNLQSLVHDSLEEGEMGRNRKDKNISRGKFST